MTDFDKAPLWEIRTDDVIHVGVIIRRTFWGVWLRSDALDGAFTTNVFVSYFRIQSARRVYSATEYQVRNLLANNRAKKRHVEKAPTYGSH